MKETFLEKLLLILLLLGFVSHPIYGHGLMAPKSQKDIDKRNLMPWVEIPLNWLADIDGGRFETQDGSEWKSF